MFDLTTNKRSKALPNAPLLRLLSILLIVSMLLSPVGAFAAPREAASTWPLTNKVIFFSSDGMRPDLMDKYVAEGVMPTYADLLANGVAGENGLLQGFPPNTGAGWYTLATGTWPGEHGSTNNTFHRTGEGNFNNRTSFATTGILQADSLHQAAERAGKTVVSVEWVGARNYVPALQGPVVDFRTFFSNRGVLLNYDLPGQPAGANAFGVSYQRVDLDPAAGWLNVPASFSPPMQEQLKLTNTAFPLTNNFDRFFDLYIYDSTDDSVTNYDRVLVVPSTSGKNGNAAVADLAAGDWADVKVTLIDALAGKTGGFYLKAIDIAPDLSTFRIYFTSIARANASYNALGTAGSLAFEETLNHDFPSSTAADFSPLEAGIVDEDTYVEQGLKWKDAHWAYLEYIINNLGVDPDLLFLGNPVTDEFAHQFMGLVTPTDMDGNPNPYYDDLTNDDIPDGRIDEREGYIRAAYHEADQTLALGRTLMGSNAMVFASSDHGFAPQWYVVNVSKALQDLGYGPEQGSNCRAVAATLVKECHAGGTVQLYIDLAGRDPAGTANANLPQVAAADYETVRNNLINYFTNLDDPNLPGQQQVVEAVFKKEELRDVDGTNALHPNRSGDVVVVFRPPYQSDAATPGTLIAFSQFFGQHGYLPDLVDLEHNVNMHGTFVAAGPGIRHQDSVDGIRAIDLAPTIAFLMGIPGPQNASGKILYDLTTGQGKYKELTILQISDYHGQLVPLSEASDSFGPTFAIGGSAFLKPWFDLYRAEAREGVLTVAGGDSVGATPPISNFFEDKPTIEIMNMMGFTSDGLGNHNFDRGQAFLRTEQIPLADYPFISANLVNPATNKTPPEWKPSVTWNFEGFKFAIVGFSNEDLTSLIFPGNLAPFVVKPIVPAVNAEIARLRAKGVKMVVAIGHEGATAGTFDNPTGPLITVADGLVGADAVLGDHSDFQTITTRPNGVLVTENRSKGIRFTRLRLVLDASTQSVVYKTADWHKPWNIGITADAEIQASINDLNAQLAPIFNTVVGKSTVVILRSDACAAATGRTDGRACESLIGDLVTDALRWSYTTDFALTNSGGLRADLTCPAGPVDPNPNDFCPPSVYPVPNAGLYPITRGQVLGVLPFGNVSATLTINGAELKDYLETAVSSLPATGNGRFGQVSGLCFTFDIQGSPATFASNGIVVPGTGSRVLSAVRQAANGSCTGAPISFSALVNYTLTTNDFTASGGDGYPNNRSRMTTQDILDQDLADYIAAQPGGMISPAIQSRIHCTDSNPLVAPACPVGSP